MTQAPRDSDDAPRREPTPRVVQLGFAGDDVALVRSLREGDPGAPAALFDRHGEHVLRVLSSVLGVDAELPELLHEVFTQALQGLHGLREPAHLKAWLSRIAVFSARGLLRARKRRRWLRFFAPDELPEIPVEGAPFEAREAVRALYAALERLSPDDRIVFSLRYLSGMELTEVAEACTVSLATIKRRLGRAEGRFCELARDDPHLRSFLEEGSRWTSR